MDQRFQRGFVEIDVVVILYLYRTALSNQCNKIVG